MAIQDQVSSLFPFSQPQYQPNQMPFESPLMPFMFQPQPGMVPQVPAAIPTQEDPTSVLMQALATRLARPPETRSGPTQPARHLGVAGREITAADPTGSGVTNFFSTPEQVQANLASGKTINSLTPQLMQYNQANVAGVPQSQVVPTAQPSVLGGLTMQGPYGVGSSQLAQQPAATSPGFAEAMQLKYQQNPFALFAQQQTEQQKQNPFGTAQMRNYR